MTFGITPFKARTQEETFANILKADIEFPDDHIYPVSSALKSIIKKLLHPESKKRLGHSHGAADVKKHKFFDKINLTLIRNLTPPIIPKVEEEEDIIPTDDASTSDSTKENEEEKDVREDKEEKEEKNEVEKEDEKTEEGGKEDKEENKEERKKLHSSSEIEELDSGSSEEEKVVEVSDPNDPFKEFTPIERPQKPPGL